MAELDQSFDEHDMSGIPENLQPGDDNVQPEDDSQSEEKQEPNDTALRGVENRDTSLGGVENRWPGWPGETVFRILVPTQKVGGIIGRKGEFIKKMCEETRARIKILDGPPGIAERAVLAAKF